MKGDDITFSRPPWWARVAWSPTHTAASFNRKERQERKARLGLKKGIPFALFAVALGLATGTAVCAEEAADSSVRLYDVAANVPNTRLAGWAAKRVGWTRVPEGDLKYVLKGDAIIQSDRLTVLFSGSQLAAVSFWAGAVPGPAPQGRLVPFPVGECQMTSAKVVRIVENTSAAVTLEVDFVAENGRHSSARFSVSTGQPTIQVRPGESTERLGCQAGFAYSALVVPDFFGDDMVFSSRPRGGYRVPAENILIGLDAFGAGATRRLASVSARVFPDSVTVCTWEGRDRRVWAVISSYCPVDDCSNSMSSFEIENVAGKPIWVSCLVGPGICYEPDSKDPATGKPVPWQPPFPAKWRKNLAHGDGLAESLTFESPPVFAPGRYFIYPLDRTSATPLTEFTPVDILRNTLGVGPCQYILETEGLASADNPTPDNVLTWVEKQAKKKGGKDAADDIRERLKAMVELAGRTEVKIKRYADFAAEMRELLASDNSEAGQKLKSTADAIAQAAAAGLAATQPPGRVVKLSETISGLIGKDTAAADLAAPAADLRAIGVAQDRALAKSRMAVRWLGCQAPAAEIARRTEAFLQGK